MRKIEKLTNQYSVSKTLCFKLIPVGKTEEHFAAKKYLESDEKLAGDYALIKDEIKAYHRAFIDSCLKDFKLDGLEEYYELYRKSEKTDAEKKRLTDLQSKMKSAITEKFTKDERYKKAFGKELLSELLPSFSPQDKQEMISSFGRFTTYFTGFNQNLNNIYSDGDKSTAIAYRLVNQNLSKFLDNCRAYDVITEKLSGAADAIYRDFSAFMPMPVSSITEILKPEYFNCVLTQSGIDFYNQLIGGYTTQDNCKIKGLNEYINDFNQTSEKKVPKLKQLFKQILSESSSISYLPEKFISDSEIIPAITKFFDELSEKQIFHKIDKLFSPCNDYDLSHVYIKSKELRSFSQKILNDWSALTDYFSAEYDKEHAGKKVKNTEAYEKKKADYFKKIKSYPLSKIFGLIEREKYFTTLKENIGQKITAIQENYRQFKTLNPADKLLGNEQNTEVIKNLLDAIKELKDLLFAFDSETDELKDELFYGDYDEIYRVLSDSIALYDKTRNYITKKPYSNEKIKLNFGNPVLLNGWVDSHTEKSDNGMQYGGYLFRKKNCIGEYDYFLGISSNKKLFRNAAEVEDDEYYEKLEYYQLKEQTIYGKSYVGDYSNDKQLLANAIKNFAFGKEIDLEKATTPVAQIKLIKTKYPSLYNELISDKDFIVANNNLISHLKSTLAKLTRVPEAIRFSQKEYGVFSELMDDVELFKGNKKVFNYIPVSRSEMEQACDDKTKPLFLFKIANKDLEFAQKKSEGLRKKRGKDNLHTIYFRELMEGNGSTFDLGSGEVFYRKKSLPYYETHKANSTLNGKTEETKKKTYTFPYALCKDRRYMFDQFSLHLSTIINYDKPDNVNKGKIGELGEIGKKVRSYLRECDNNYVIGIDRGERNLLYVCVIDGNGQIVKQFTGNLIENEHNTKDYQALLSAREVERDKARKSWKSINGIADLKKGYLSQIIHKICLLVEEYDAVIAMEDLNYGFKNGRKNVEKSVYQEFEKMLIEKLNFLVFKDKAPDEAGGLRRAYQLTDNFKSFKDMSYQNGIIFYIPAWNTSKIDPTTGFVNLLKPKYSTVESAREFFGKFRSIRYEPQKDLFSFSFDYSDFPNGGIDYKKAWTAYSYGDRVQTFRAPEKNNEWSYKKINLTQFFKAVFGGANISYADGHELIADILKSKRGKEFYTDLIKGLSLVLQMRNSVGKTDEDYILSPVLNKSGEFYDSRNYSGKEAPLPCNADANGAYHIAKKCLWAIEKIKAAGQEEYLKTPISIGNKEWLEYVQKANE